MAKIDETKEIIGFLKILFAMTLATAIALIGWTARYYNSIDNKLFIMSILAFVFLQFWFIILLKKIKIKLDELKKL